MTVTSSNDWQSLWADFHRIVPLSRDQRRRLRGDPDRIVAHAVDPDPEQRYADARELGEDIERYLGSFPVHARPPSRSYRLKRFVGRHPLGAATGLVVVLGVLAFGSALWWQALALEEALDESRNATARAEGLSAFLAELLVEADPQVNQGQPRSVDDVLADAARRLSSGDGIDPARSAALQTTLADIFHGRGDYARARDMVERALATNPDTAPARLLRARLDLIDGRHADVLAATQALIADGSPESARAAGLLRAETFQGMDDLAAAGRILDALVLDDGGDTEAAVEAWFRQGGLHWGRGDFAAAEASYRQAHELQIARHGADSIQAVRGLKAIASARYRQSDLATAERLFRQALARQEAILDPGHPRIAETRVRLGALLYDRQAFDAAVI
jgi:serine/threonine-protein kinase